MTATPTSDPDVLAADRRFFDALLAADADALEGLLDPQFLIVDVAAGDVTARADFIAFVISGQVRFERIDTFADEAVVRHLGGCAVVVGRTAMRFTMPDGAQVEAASRYTHVFTPGGADPGWRLASAQGTALPGS